MNRRNLIELLIAAPLAALGIKALPKRDNRWGWVWRHPLQVGAGLYTGPAGMDIYEGDLVIFYKERYVRPEFCPEKGIWQVAINRALEGERLVVSDLSFA